MPYVTFPAGSLPGFGRAHASKDAAIAARTGNEAIGFDASLAERDAWHAREANRLQDGTYTAVPWADCLQEIAANEPIRIDTESEGEPESGIYRAPFTQDEADKATRLVLHFAHMSVSHPGMIAYTPDDTYGHEDRQLRVTVGRYLERFGLPGWDKGQCEEYIGTVKALTGESLHFAKTPDEIARVYVADCGFTSCMDGRDFPYDDTPVRAYGDSDLQLAYLGQFAPGDSPSNRDVIKARCLVWPARKTFGRCYGDESTLQAALQAAGYTHSSYFDGAKIRAIEDGSRYVMPYVDGAYSADLNGEWFILRRGEGGEYRCRDTNGYTEANSPDLCPHCDAENDGNGEGEYCDDCRDNVTCCDDCGESYHMDNEGSSHDHGSLCGHCSRQHRHDCEHCDDRFSAYDFSRSERNSRDMRLCASCEDDGVTECAQCSSFVDSTDDDANCAECAQALQDAADEAARQARLDAARVKPRPRGYILLRHAAGNTAERNMVAIANIQWNGASTDVRA